MTYLPAARRGEARPAAAVEAWVTAGWLMAVELRAYLEDLDGGAEQPAMQAVVMLRVLELLTQIDSLLGGARMVAEEHALARALEHGLSDVARLDPAAVARCFRIGDALSPDAADPTAVRALCEELLSAFPGAVPDPLVADGQGATLRALRDWSRLSAVAEIDPSFLEPFLKEA